MDRDAKLAAYARAVGDHPLKGKNQPYTSLNGNMFTFLAPDGTLAMRLSDDDRAAFDAEHGTAPVTQYGRVMRGYVEVPDGVTGNDRALAALFARSAAHAATLKPKPTKR